MSIDWNTIPTTDPTPTGPTIERTTWRPAQVGDTITGQLAALKRSVALYRLVCGQPRHVGAAVHVPPGWRRIKIHLSCGADALARNIEERHR